MSSNKNIQKPSSGSNDLSRFLAQAEQLPQRVNNQSAHQGRLIFALDATASRQPTWDRACHLQAQMFQATNTLGGIALQLCYFRGFNEFHISPWFNSSQPLLKTMSAVQCLGGYTQIGKVLDHCWQEHAKQAVNGVIIIGDAVEESVDKLCAKAGKLGMVSVPLFMFQEGHDPNVQQCFQQMAHLSKGAYASFDESSASKLAELLSAVAIFATGGIDALQKLQTSSARHLLQQIQG